MPRRPSITIVGAGSFGSALAQLLAEAGYKVSEIVTRAGTKPSKAAVTLARRLRSRAIALDRAALDADVLWLCVPDDGIADCASELSKRNPKSRMALHSSGALGSDALATLRGQGLAVATAHPLMSFVKGPAPSLQDVLFAVEGDAPAFCVASKIAHDLGGVTFTIRKEQKAVYHAFGAFTSPLLIAHLSAAETLARAAGVPKTAIRKAMKPIVMKTLSNYFEKGAAAAFSGPLVRGDVETIRKHLAAMRGAPEARDVYQALVRQALETLPIANRASIVRLLNGK